MASCFEETNLQKILEKIAEDEGFRNPKFNITGATNSGDNFIGQVFRVKIDGLDQKKSLSLIFKVSSPNRSRTEKLKSGNLFRVESEMYETVLPTLNNFLKKRGLSNSPIFPGTARFVRITLLSVKEECYRWLVIDFEWWSLFRCYATAVNRSEVERDVIVLEDKKVEGYTMANVKEGLDAAQCRLALQRVALLHSSSLALRALEPETADRLSKILYKLPWGKEDLIMIDFKRGYLEGLDFLGEPYTAGNPVYQKLLKFHEDFMDEFFKLAETPEDIACVNHGDFWTNNILFKPNQDGIAEDACMIDFQLAYLKSPIVDITFLLFVCTTKEVRDKHYDDLIQFYFDELTKTLLDCGCNPESVLPRTKFLEHLQFYSKFGVILAIASLPVLMAGKSEIIGDVHSAEGDQALFFGTTKIKDPETLKKLSERMNGVVEDAEAWGYI